MTERTYLIAHFLTDDGTEEFCEYTATSLTEALMMAERSEAGTRNVAFGIRPEDYAQARAEGITFNEADGLLVDADA